MQLSPPLLIVSLPLLILHPVVSHLLPVLVYGCLKPPLPQPTAFYPRGALIMSGFRRSRFHSFLLRLGPGNDNRYVTHVVSSHEK